MSVNSVEAFDREEEEKLSQILAQLDMVAVYESKAIYDSLVQAYPTTLGKAVSKKERDENNLKDSTLVYGEIPFETFGTIIEKIKKIYGKPNVGASGPSGILQNRGGIFYDLGSGTGKVVIAAAVLHNFDVCYGIETLEGLFAVSLDCLNTYNTRGKAKLSGRENDTHCQMVHGDFLKTRAKDWRDADVIFANSTCYDENIITKMTKIALGLKKGAFIITLTKRLPSADFEVVECLMYKMSWGEATIFILQKVTQPYADVTNESDEEDDHQ